MFYVYILESHKGLYIGSTNDLKRRLLEHNAGQNIATKSGRPWLVIFYEAHLNQTDALRREKYLKTTQGRQAIQRMLREYLNSKGKR